MTSHDVNERLVALWEELQTPLHLIKCQVVWLIFAATISGLKWKPASLIHYTYQHTSNSDHTVFTWVTEPMAGTSWTHS